MLKLNDIGNSYNVWFTSDTHYNHKNISCFKESQWIDGYRDFSSLEEHNMSLIDSINNNVDKNDILFHLGDWSFGGFESVREFRDQINCKNIHLILGNHDHFISLNKDNVQNIFSSVNSYSEVVLNKEMFVLSHYALRIWNRSHRGSIHLYGHSHGSLDYDKDGKKLQNGKSMDVGIDAVYKLTGEYRPINYTEIKQIMETSKIKFIDHHDNNTD